MKQYIKRLFSDSAAFAIATMGNKLVSAMLGPVFIAYLSMGKYADWGQTNVVTMVLQYVCILGTDAAMAFYFYDAKTVEDRRIYFTNALLFSAGTCIVFTLLVYLFGGPLTDALYANSENYTYLLPVAFLATVGAIVIQHILGYARYSRRVWTFNIFSMAYVIGSNLLSILFLAYFHDGVMGIFYGQLIGQVGVALILLYLFRGEFHLKISRRHLSDLIRYGAPLLPTLLAFWAMSSVSRPIIYHLASPEHAAIYEAVMRLASIIVLITSPFQLAWRPFSMSIKDREDAPELFALVGRALLVVGTLAVMILTFFIQWIYGLYTVGKHGYGMGYIYVWAVSLGTFFNVLQNVFGVGLMIKKKTKVISYGFMIAAVVYLVGNLILVPIFNIWGSVSMTVLAYLIVIVWVYYQNQKVYPINFRFRSIAIYLAVFFISMIGITYVQANHLENAWLYYLLALGVTMGTVFATGLFSIRSLNRIGRALPKLGGKG
ncbi:polysaccharide biosynthesis C-terminal domain-containing protein [Thermoactinomyces daqus]|uniref:Polysaccharide biosynthesis C-terminal domain-containing protein n=1 Tax=Thermoactinomyces daqus TaxID=1329516 RepID=A0A7W1X849_9BACL|nr:polysaccharide biosynthesis C-terminal domain-containing protein [Thermoactinomyces daqus]MBA4541807.1 polysaccharide biosynthesis C-terminal domain-containing protein [Thermoactinomyces daqus]